MKSVRMIAGIVLCLLLLCSQAIAASIPAVTLTFDNVYDDYKGSLTAYGDDFGVKFSGWGLAEEDGDVEIWKRAKSTEASTVITFDAVPVSLFGFDIDLSGPASMTATTSSGTTPLTFTFTNSFVAENYLPEGWSTYFIKSIRFDLASGSKLFVDNVAYTPTPLPGAAVLLFSGLLGLVGLRRRELV